MEYTSKESMTLIFDFIQATVSKILTKFFSIHTCLVRSLTTSRRSCPITNSNMQEQQFYQWLRSNISGDVARIESVVGSGVPDVNICYNGCEIWVELKVLDPKRVLLRPEQYAWGMRRSNNGGSCFVVCKDIQNPVIHIWQYPHIECLPSGKYARIVTPSHKIIDQDSRQLMKSLFPMF